MTDLPISEERYVLATGDAAEERLGLVEEVHGKDTLRLLQSAGVRRGMRVVDMGCGAGVVTCALARLVGAEGHVVGVDISPEQTAVAERRAREHGIHNVTFVTASAYNTGLDRGAFDAAFARFLLMHVARPAEVLREMTELLRTGGLLIVEDGDFTAPYCIPGSPAFTRCFDLYREAVRRQGADPEIGPMLPALVLQQGYPCVNISIVQPVFKEGAVKRLPGWTLEEAAPLLMEQGIATEKEIEAVTREMERLAADPTTVFGMAQMTQVWAVKPPSAGKA